MSFYPEIIHGTLVNLFSPSRTTFRCLLMALVGLQIFLATSLYHFPLPLRVAIYLIYIVGLSGWLTAAIIYPDKSLWLQLAFGMALGFAEWIVLSRLWLHLEFPVHLLLVPLTILSSLKAIWLGRDSYKVSVRFGWTRSDAILSLPSFGILMLMAIAVVVVHSRMPYFPIESRVDDKTFYNMAIERFASLSGDLNWMFDRLVFGSNIRVTWNPWLFALANMRVTTNIPTIQLTFAQLRPVLWFVPFISYVVFMSHIFKRPWMVLFAAALQISFVVNADFDYFMFRLEEDKVLVLFALMPFVWTFLIRTLRWHHKSDLFSFFMVTIMIALIHPMGIPAIILVGVPFVGIHWLTSLNKLSELKWVFFVLCSVGVGGIYTLWERQQVLQTLYVQSVLDANGNLPQLPFFGSPVILSDIERLVFLLWIVLFLIAPKKYVGRFVISMTVLVTLYLSVSPLQAFASFVLTTVGLSRLHWLLPFGIALSYCVIIALSSIDYWNPRLRLLIRFAVVGLTLMISFGLGSYGATLAGGRWTPPYQESLPKFSFLPDAYFDEIVQLRELIGDKRIITDLDIATMIPTLFPRAEIIVYNALSVYPTTFQSVGALYRSNDDVSVKGLLDYLQPEFLLTIGNVQLEKILLQRGADWDYSVAYAGKYMTLFQHSSSKPMPYKMPISFYAEEIILARGECTTLYWDSAEDALLDGKIIDHRGSQQVCLDKTTSYFLETSHGLRETTIFVEEKPSYKFNITGSHLLIEKGECSILQWKTDKLQQLRLYLPTEMNEASKVVEANGNLEVCPTESGAYVWSAKSEEGKTVIRTLTLYVLPD